MVRIYPMRLSARKESLLKMSDEINEKTIGLIINGGKISARIFKKSLTALLRDIEQKDSMKRSRQIRSYGKQSIQSLQKQNMELTNIEVTDKNIRSFERYARKYGITYALKKDRQVQPPRYVVFFKGRDVDTMKAAFKEYTQYELNKEKKPSLRKNLRRMVERAAKQQEREKSKKRDREEAR